jgi:hypothetical protein
MNILVRFTLLVTFCVACSVCLRAQDSAASRNTATQQEASKPSEATPAAAQQDGNATLYFYRIKQFSGSALEPSVFCDEKDLARMDNGRYFGVTLAPGKHTCRMGDKQTGFELDVKPGQSYYAKVSLEVGFWKGHGRLTLIQPEQGAFELKKVKPLGADKVKDRTLVTVYEGSDKASKP